jgi:hypothetical protein
MAMRVSGDDPLALKELLRMSLMSYTAHCEAFLEKLVAAKKARDASKRNQKARGRR